MEKDNTYNNNKIISESNILACIIKCFLSIKELNNIFSTMDINKNNNLSPILYQYYKCLKNNNEQNMVKLENEIKKEIEKQITKNPIENIIETLIILFKCQYMFTRKEGPFLVQSVQVSLLSLR